MLEIVTTTWACGHDSHFPQPQEGDVATFNWRDGPGLCNSCREATEGQPEVQRIILALDDLGKIAFCDEQAFELLVRLCRDNEAARYGLAELVSAVDVEES